MQVSCRYFMHSMQCFTITTTTIPAVVVASSRTSLSISLWAMRLTNYLILAGPVQIAQLCHLYSVENLLEHNT